jgi:DNA repair protein REV1
MGHGRCETFNKTCSISGIRGAATDDPDVIGREAWKLLQSMRLDPTELRGIGIQIQKFEVPEKSFASGVTAHGQLVKRFQQAVAAINAEKQQVPIHLNRVTPMQPANALVIPAEPSHNGGHKTVPGCKEVPYDLTGPTQADPKSNACSNTGARQFVPPLLHPITKSPEVASPANNFHDRHLNSAKPGTTPIPDVTVIDVDALDDKYIPAPAPGNKDSPFDLTMLSQLDQAAVTELVIIGNDRARSLSAPRLDRPGTNAKAGSLSPRRAQGRKRLTNMGPPTVIPDPSRYFPIFKRQFAPIPDQELVALDIDPMVYARMTKDQQKALISARRAAKGLDGAGRPIRQRKRQKKEDDNKPVYQVILAGKTELPTLRTATPGAPAVTETTDIQDMIRAWVETKVAKKLGPDPREVAHFGGFLERSMASDQGMQRTVEVMKWWRHVCMNNWGQEQEKRGQYGREWWVAWWDVKDKLDLIVKKRFGGKLNLD